MRTELIDINDITDSREVMAKKTPLGISVFIMIVTVLLIVALIWAYFGKLDTYAKMTGEIRPKETASTITAVNGGVIKNIFFDDGSQVNAGDILFELDSDYYKKQKKITDEQILETEQAIKNNETLITAIKQDKNLFDKETASDFYHQYENYAIELNSAISQLSISNEQITASIKEIEKGMETAKQSLANSESSYREYKALYSAIENNEKYESTNQSLKTTYDSYIISQDKANAAYNSYKQIYDSLCKQNDAVSGSVSEDQLNQADYNAKVAYNDMLNIKNSCLSNIDGIMRELEQQITTCKANIDTYQIKKNALSPNNTSSSTKEKIKNSYYLSINDTVNTLKQKLISLRSQSAELATTISNSQIKAAQKGELVLSQNYAVGDTVNAGGIIANIIPNGDDYTVTLFVEEKDIAALKSGQRVEFIFSAISSTDYGKVYGEIVSISADSFADQQTGAKFYKADATIEKTELFNKDGETLNIKVGMLTEAHAITGTQSILSWLLDKLSFM